METWDTVTEADIVGERGERRGEEERWKKIEAEAAALGGTGWEAINKKAAENPMTLSPTHRP